MVGDEVVTWNPFLYSLISLSNELEELELVYFKCTVSYMEVRNV